MASFGGLVFTNKGRALQGKAQSGAVLNYTRIAIGDGSLSGQSVSELNGLISEKKTLSISKLRPLGNGQAVVGAVLSNQTITTGFYFRELGVFAIDPDVGEILYCYGNAGAAADYIPGSSGGDILERAIDVITIVGTASNITATIDQSLVFATKSDFDNHKHTGLPGDAPKIDVTGLADGAVTSPKIAPSIALAGSPTATTPPAGTNNDQIATAAFVQASISALINNSPSALDTLKELAAALGNDPNFATTITNALATKAPLANPVFTGTGVTLPADPTNPMHAVTMQWAQAQFAKATKYAP